MSSFQIEGKQVSASRLRSLLFRVANSLPRKSAVLGSVDSDPYGMQVSFVLPDGVLGMSIMKGGLQ